MRRNNTFRWIIIILAIFASLYYLYPTYKFQSLTPEETERLEREGELFKLTNKAIKRGLDLQGGMKLTLEVDLYKMAEDLATRKDNDFYNVLDQTDDLVKLSNEDFYDIFERVATESNVQLTKYYRSESRGRQDVIDYLKEERERAVVIIRQKLVNRIDQFGVSEPTIQRQGRKRINVELPGLQNAALAKELIGKTAVLQFKLLKDSEIFSQVIKAVDRVLIAKRDNMPMDSMMTAEIDTAASIPEDTSAAALDTAKVETVPSTDTEVNIADLFGEQGTDTSAAAGESRALVDENIYSERPFSALLRSYLDYGGDIAVPEENFSAVRKIIEMEEVQSVIPRDAEFAWSPEPVENEGKMYYELHLLKKDAELTGEVITDARASINQSMDPSAAGKPEVLMQMDRDGSRRWSRITGANINKRIAIVLDDRVFSAPRVISKIPNGSSQITNIETMDEAKLLAIVLRAGALPASVKFMEERTVGPTLGRDSIRKGSLSALLGLTLIMVFMIIYYKMSGAIANIALILDIIFLMAIMAGFHATLTLPGIAGIVLTIGMAIDANVLIFERIREELNTGKTIRAAIDNGYGRAFTTILDANLTTLIIALVLYQFGTGPVKGFAVTLSVGIVCSMFTAIVVTRVIFDFITKKWTLRRLSI
ncbi:protein translocase subunit SecD [candidate division KSB1 bacterium]